jgi:hypothetical protein
MPLIEALSALATLLGTYQVVRGNKPPGDPAAPSDMAASGLLLAYEFAKGAAEDAYGRLDSVRARLGFTVVASGLTVAGGAVIAGVGDGAVDLDSPLFLVALGLFAFIAAMGILARNASSSGQASPREVYDKHLTQPDAGMLQAMLAHVQSAYERTEALVALSNRVLLVLSAVFVVQVVLLAVWIPVEH